MQNTRKYVIFNLGLQSEYFQQTALQSDVLIWDSVSSASHVADDELSKKLSQLTPGQKKAAIDILNAYTDNIPYITK